MANDNEDGIRTHADGSVNVLFGSGPVRYYSYQDLQKRFRIADFDPDRAMRTWGSSSPIPECRRLANGMPANRSQAHEYLAASALTLASRDV
ncbi:MAG: hypothetical protein AB8H80_22230 [Planctomycetota bacterium]